MLQKLTMYKVVAIGLCALSAVAYLFAATGILDYDPLHMLLSMLVIFMTGFAVNQILGKIWNAPLNSDSGLITSLIIFLLARPDWSAEHALFLVVVTTTAIASKFVIARRNMHVFNPAAFGFVVVGVAGLGHASWWIGSEPLWPFVLVVGLLVVWRLQKLTFFLFFVLASIAVTILASSTGGDSTVEALKLLWTASPLIFLGTIMVTEPSTMPVRKFEQSIFVAIVAGLFAAKIHVGPVFIYPEMALLIGNLYAFAMSPMRRWQLTLVNKIRHTDELYTFVFKPNATVPFLPGQYAEWTLPMSLAKQDFRGNRRMFSIASSPFASKVELGVRIPSAPSQFKQQLVNMRPGDTLSIAHIKGEFTLPKDVTRSLVWIAGGIGITPFKAMAEYLEQAGQQRNITLLYATKSSDEYIYDDVFKRAGVTVRHCNEITPGELQAVIESDALVYVSGPPHMVDSTRSLIRSSDIKSITVKTDSFSGY